MSLASASITAQSGLAATALETSVLSRNISGSSDTTIYSRKIANVTTGVDGGQVVSVTRASNQAVFENLLTTTAAAATQDAISSGLDALNQTIGDVSSSASGTASASSPAALLSDFTNTLETYQGSPSDSSVAANAVSAAKTLASGLNSASDVVQQAREQADSDMNASVQIVNSFLGQLQTVNTQIVNGSSTGADITDLQDQRDNILSQLSQQIGIVTTTGPNNDISVYTDSGVTLFQGGIARAVTFKATNTYTATTIGNNVYVDGAPITGSGAAMPITSGKLAGLATLRDTVAVTYQAQLDNIASALIAAFGESDQAGAGPDLPGLFTTLGATALPSSVVGLASDIVINSSVDPSQGGNADLLRDGGISDTANSDYTYNTTANASYSGRISQLLANLQATQSFGAAGGISTSATLSQYAANSVSWLEAARSKVSSESSYQDTLLSTATTAMSNATGVNLDSEMSKMLDLEQSYSASAKLITAIDTMFQALLTDIGNIPA